MYWLYCWVSGNINIVEQQSVHKYMGGEKMASVKLKHVYKRYDGGVTAVNDFNLDIEDKEFLILVGPSGCGKTTTLKSRCL